MNRFLVHEGDFFLKEKNQFLKLEGELFHHVFSVLRHKKGDIVELITERSNYYQAQIIESSKRESFVKVLDKKSTVSFLPDVFSRLPSLDLCLSLSRFKTMEKIIEKSVELGVARIQPFISDFSFIRKKNKITEIRKKRWKTIIRSACRQTARGESMELEEVRFLDELWLDWDERQKDQIFGLFAYEGFFEKNLQSVFSLSSWFKNFFLNSDFSLKRILLFIGSEGGFSKREAQCFLEKGFNPISLGPRILKVETACLSLISIIKYELGRIHETKRR